MDEKIFPVKKLEELRDYCISHAEREEPIETHEVLSYLVKIEKEIEKFSFFCPRCRRVIATGGIPQSLSRRDNKTEICSSCGVEESLIDSGFMDENYYETGFQKVLKEKKS